jgi:cytidylate kinase
MAIITLSRGSYSKGKEIAEKVAACMNYDCLSREVILEASDRFNIPEIKLEKAIHDAPSILERFTHGKSDYITYYQSALTRRVRKDNVVYHGLAGHIFLGGISHLLKVRIISDLSMRVRNKMETENISEQDARAIILKDDHERRNWTQKLYGVDPWDSSLYDLVIFIDKITVEDAVNIICRVAGFKQFKATRESQQKMDDLALACEIKALLLNEHFDVSVTSDYGNVVISAKATGRQLQKLNERATQLISEVSGINNLEVHSEATQRQTVI